MAAVLIVAAGSAFAAYRFTGDAHPREQAGSPTGAGAISVAPTAPAAALAATSATPAEAGLASSSAPASASATPTATPTPTPTPSSLTPSPSPTPSVEPTLSFAQLYGAVADGVVKIDTDSCDGSSSGTGFLVAPDVIATVAHVVDGAVRITLRADGVSASGVVIGVDIRSELALVRSRTHLTGHVFALSSTQPAVGTDVAAIGFPLDRDKSMTKGAISGHDQQIETESGVLTGLLQTDTAINPGNSGGPLLAIDGSVVGLVEAKTRNAESIGFAIPATSARKLFDSWQVKPRPPAAPACVSPTPTDEAPRLVTDSSGDADGPGIAAALATYAGGINNRDYASSFGVLSPGAQARSDLDAFSRGVATSSISQVKLISVQHVAADADSVDVTFRSNQDPKAGGHGQACSDWHMTYSMVNIDQSWRIDRVKAHSGSPVRC